MNIHLILKPLFRRKSHYTFNILTRKATTLSHHIESQLVSLPNLSIFQKRIAKYCTILGQESAKDTAIDSVKHSTGDRNVNATATNSDKHHNTGDMVDFTHIHINKLPKVLIMGRPNVGKSALFNRLIRRREALVYNTPTDHVTRDIREGVAKLGNLRFKVLDSAGIEAEASSGTVLSRTAEMTGNVLSKTQFALLLVDAR